MAGTPREVATLSSLGGLSIQDCAQIATAGIAAVACVFAWLGWRAAREQLLLAAPYVHVARASQPPTTMYMKLIGEQADLWTITDVRLKRPRSVTFVRLELMSDDAGGWHFAEREPIGRSTLPKMDQVAVSTPAKVEIEVVVRLKSSPKTVRRMPIVV